MFDIRQVFAELKSGDQNRALNALGFSANIAQATIYALREGLLSDDIVIRLAAQEWLEKVQQTLKGEDTHNESD